MGADACALLSDPAFTYMRLLGLATCSSSSSCGKRPPAGRRVRERSLDHAPMRGGNRELFAVVTVLSIASALDLVVPG